MTFNFRVGKGVQNSPKKSDVIRQDRVGRSKMAEKRRTSFMDVP
jgi:hypothetical protein